MSQFVQPLESRRMLSASSLVVDEAKLGLDVTTLISEAKSARTTLVADGKAVATDLKSLSLKGTDLGKQLSTAISKGKTTIGADVVKIVAVGITDGKAIFVDWLKLEKAEANGNTAAITKDQTDLAAEVQKLWNIEQPHVTKLESDITSTETNVGNAVQNIVNANKSNATLSADWSTLQGDVKSAQSTVSTQFSDVVADVNQVISDLS